MIHISNTLQLPDNAVTQAFAFVARRGAGKTYTAQKMAEEMASAGSQIIAFDPVGNWYSLRLAADGKKSSGLNVYIFGGEYADVPLVVTAGREVARLLATQPISAVLDVSRFRKSERERFATEFCEEFFHLKKTHRTAVHLLIEEAQVFIPQQVENPRLAGAIEDIIRLGRNYGIGASLISQRPQSVNKQVLSQVECVFALQMTGPHERKALGEWLTEHGADVGLAGKLPELAIGEAFVWSPAWLRTFARVRIGKKKTYDGSSTPSVDGKVARAIALSPLDIKNITSTLAKNIEEAKADDPKELRRRIAEIETQLRKAQAAAPAVDPAAIEKAKQAARQEVARSFKPLVSAIQQFCERAPGLVPDVPSTLAELPRAPIAPNSRPAGASIVPPKRPASPAAGGESGEIGKGGLRRILVALAQRPGMSARQIGIRAGLSSSSGTFGTYLAKARTAGWIAGTRDRMEITEAGLEALGSYEPLPTGRELLAYWIGELGNSGASRMLAALAEHGAMTKDELGQAVDMSSKSGTFGTYLSKLRTLELVTVEGGTIAPSEELL